MFADPVQVLQVKWQVVKTQVPVASIMYPVLHLQVPSDWRDALGLQELQLFEFVEVQVKQVLAQLTQFPLESGKNPLLQTHEPSESLTALILQAWQEVASPLRHVAQELWQETQFPFPSA